MCVCVCVSTHAYVYVCMYVCMHACMDVCNTGEGVNKLELEAAGRSQGRAAAGDEDRVLPDINESVNRWTSPPPPRQEQRRLAAAAGDEDRDGAGRGGDVAADCRGRG